MKAFVVEPQRLFVPFISNVLRAGGIDVAGTSDDVDGSLIASLDPDVVIVDVDCFERSAATTICRVRDAARRPILVALSEATDPLFEATCHIAGANAVVSKSHTDESLVKTIRALGFVSRGLVAASARRPVHPKERAAPPHS